MTVDDQLRFVKVLDHGHVRLVNFMGSDLSVVRAARVSYNAEWRSGADEGADEKLLRYLLQNGHTSPLEHVTFTFDIKCPIFIARQWHRHRTWSYNEVSARYTSLPEEYYVPRPEHIGVQSKDNKQVREIKAGIDTLVWATDMAELIRHQSMQAFRIYKHLLEQGCPRELARTVLPLNTYTHFFGSVDLHNLLHFIDLRLHPHAQWEIQQYGKALLELIRPVVPVVCKIKYGASS